MEYSLRRKSRAINDDDAVGVLRRCNWGVLSIVGPDETPYGVPLNYALMENGQDKKIIFHCAREGRKIDYLKLRPQAAFVVVEDAAMLPDKFSTAYASAMVSGRVAIVDDPEAKRELLKFFVQKLAPDYLERGDKHIEHRLHECLVLQMEVESMCGKGRKREEPYALAHLGF